VRTGEKIVLFCGDGREHEAVLEVISSRDVTARIVGTTTPAVELPCFLHVAVAALKGEKLDWTIQKLTELGVARVTLLETERTVRHAGDERWARRLERYTRIATEAAEQSGRLVVPAVAGPASIEEVLSSSGSPAFFLDPRAERLLTAALRPVPRSILLLVGPEGGFTPAEEERAVEAGAVRVGLGRRTLRAETAAIAAAAVAAMVVEVSTGCVDAK
jgi:16S rRNA (uracil1498-N3)-methyltransferase